MFRITGGEIQLFIILCGLVALCWGAYKFVLPLTDRLFKNKDVNDEYAEGFIQKKDLGSIKSIARKFYLIRENPTRFSKDIREIVTLDFKKVLEGKIKDPERIHAPDEKDEDGDISPEYEKYLENQGEALGKDSWHYKEFRRIQEENHIVSSFMIQLLDMGANASFIRAMTTSKRIEEYSPEDWEKLIEATNEYAEDYHQAVIIYYLENIDDKETLLDRDKFEMFAELLEKDIPEKAAAVFLKANLEISEIGIILELIEKGYTIEEATTLVLNSKKTMYDEEIARKEMDDLLK